MNFNDVEIFFDWIETLTCCIWYIYLRGKRFKNIDIRDKDIREKENIAFLRYRILHLLLFNLKFKE